MKHPRNRQRAYLSGRRAERIACWLLRLKGYRILAVNWRCTAGEVDILARRGRVLAAVEVKRRAGGLVAGEAAEDAALFAISPHQQARVARAAATFAARRSDCRELELRLDAITVTSPTSGWSGRAGAGAAVGLAAAFPGGMASRLRVRA